MRRVLSLMIITAVSGCGQLNEFRAKRAAQDLCVTTLRDTMPRPDTLEVFDVGFQRTGPIDGFDVLEMRRRFLEEEASSPTRSKYDKVFDDQAQDELNSPAGARAIIARERAENGAGSLIAFEFEGETATGLKARSAFFCKLAGKEGEPPTKVLISGSMNRPAARRLIDS